MSPNRDGLIIQLPVPVDDPAATVRLARQVDRVLRNVRTAVCSGWTPATADAPEPRPYLAAWLDLDLALVLTHLDAGQAVIELHIRTNRRTGSGNRHPRRGTCRTPGQPCCRTAD